LYYTSWCTLNNTSWCTLNNVSLQSLYSQLWYISVFFSIPFLLLSFTFLITLIFTHSLTNFYISSKSPSFRNYLVSHHITVTNCCLCFLWIISNCCFLIFFISLFYFISAFNFFIWIWNGNTIFIQSVIIKKVQVQSLPTYGHQLTTFSRLLWLIIWIILRIIWPN
jgi:hypothetical protein